MSLLEQAFRFQNLDATLQILVVGEDAKVVSRGNCAKEDVDRATLDAVILAEIEQARGFYVIVGGNFFVEKRIEQLFSLGELRSIPDSGQYFLADRADDRCEAIPYGVHELQQHLLLVRADAGDIATP